MGLRPRALELIRFEPEVCNMALVTDDPKKAEQCFLTMFDMCQEMRENAA